MIGRGQGWSTGVARWSLAVALVAVLAACGGDDGASSPTAADAAPTAVATTATTASEPLAGQLTVFAAASLTEAFEEIRSALQAANPDLEITFNFAGSQALATQLTQGADADVFASANSTQMKAAQDGGVIVGDPVVFTRNRLVIVVPKDNPGAITQPGDLAKSGLKIVIAAPDVPVGKYTLEMLDKMSADPSFGGDFRSKVEANVVSHEDNVKQVVTKVQLGEADAGVVYVTDITADVAADVASVEVPEQLNVIAEYPIALVANGNSALGQDFIDYLFSEDGQQTLIAHGFTVLP